MVQKDLILDFNLYLCEKFGYRESCSVMSHAKLWKRQLSRLVYHHCAQ